MQFVDTTNNTQVTGMTGPNAACFLETTEDVKKHTKEMLKFIKKAKYLAFDIETARADGRAFTKGEGVGWNTDLFCCFSFSDGSTTYVVHNAHMDPAVVRPVLEAIFERPLAGQNIKFDLKFVKRDYGLVPKSILFDTEIASRIVQSSKGRRHALDIIMARELNISLDKGLQKSNWGGFMISTDQICYSARDTQLLPRLIEVLVAKMNKNMRAKTKNLDSEYIKIWGCWNKVMALEMELLPVFIDMESNGFHIDRDQLRIELKNVQDREYALLEEFTRIAPPYGGKNRLLPRSTTPMLRYLKSSYPDASYVDEFGKTRRIHELEGVGQDELKPFKGQGQMIDLLVNLRGMTAQINRIKEFDELSSDSNPRIYTSYRQCGTDTGRTSNPKPNLQNIPSMTKEGQVNLRKLFTAPEGSKLVVADYNQAQLRISAEYTLDPLMLKILNENEKGKDLHYQTAAIITGKKIEDVTKEERKKSKPVNFGVIFGQSPGGLMQYARDSYEVYFTLAEARDIIDKFFESYAGTKAWLDKVKKSEFRGHYTNYTVFGRKVMADTFTAATNYVIQGSEASIMKMAMVLIDREQRKTHLPFKLCNMIHDELVAECEEKYATEVLDLIERNMVKSGTMMLKNVKTLADGVIVDNWAAAK